MYTPNRCKIVIREFSHGENTWRRRQKRRNPRRNPSSRPRPLTQVRGLIHLGLLPPAARHLAIASKANVVEHRLGAVAVPVSPDQADLVAWQPAEARRRLRGEKPGVDPEIGGAR